jgi:hypothetical protein
VKNRRAWRFYANSVIASEISTMTRHYDQLIQYAPVPGDDGLLFGLVECPLKRSLPDSLPDLTSEHDERTAILLNGNLNHSTDIEGVLFTVAAAMNSTSRVIAVVYNPYFGWIYNLAAKLGIRSPNAPSTFVTLTDLLNIARLSGLRVVRNRSAVYCPFKWWGLGDAINAVMPVIPFLRHLSLTVVSVLAPIKKPHSHDSLTVVLPARNEAGNIRPALEGMRTLSRQLPRLEVIIVEGHSTDGTWDEIQRLLPEFEREFAVHAFRQTGSGKSDAVRLGFANASGDVLTILDADLTVAPALLGRFWKAYHEGYGEFVNGSRLVYSAENQAMRFLNRIGNVAFAKMLSRILSVRIGDSLCGTKLFARHDYARFVSWRAQFGEFDPFGDFELLFPAAELGLTIVDVPVRYGARTYGETNISRFRHGFMLLKMTMIGFFKVRLGRTA